MRNKLAAVWIVLWMPLFPTLGVYGQERDEAKAVSDLEGLNDACTNAESGIGLRDAAFDFFESASKETVAAANCYMRYARSMRGDIGPNMSHYFAKMAFEIYESHYDEEDPEYYVALFAYLEVVNDREKKVLLYEYLLQQRKDKGEDKGMQYVELMYELGNAYYDVGRNREAEALQAEAAQIMQERYFQPESQDDKPATREDAMKGVGELIEVLEEFRDPDGSDPIEDVFISLFTAIEQAFIILSEDNSVTPEEKRVFLLNYARKLSLSWSYEQRNPGNLQDFESFYALLSEGQEASRLTDAVSLIIPYAIENPDDEEIVYTAADIILELKGIQFESIASTAQLVRERTRAVPGVLLEEAHKLERKTSSLVLQMDKSSQKRVSKALADLDAAYEALSTKFAPYVKPVKDDPNWWGQEDILKYIVTWDTPLPEKSIYVDRVMDALPAHATLIEYIKYYERVEDVDAVKDISDVERYAALVLDAAKKPRIIDIGKAKEIHSLITTYRREVEAFPKLPAVQRKNAHYRFQEIATSLYSKLVAPLQLDVSLHGPLLFSLDDQLFLIPFETLITQAGAYLIDLYEISYLGTGRDLLRSQVVTQPGEMFIFAGADFDGMTHTDAPNTKRRSRGRKSEGIVHRSALFPFEALPGTYMEATQIETLFEPEATQVFLGAQATEKHLLSLQNPWRLHIATHGFFLPENPILNQDSTLMAYNNPLYRSGLALAGANTYMNQADPEGYDGIVTGFELKGMDLRNTDMVVLSACETGLGELVTGEGVFGLQRSFQLAGAQTVVMSLWNVEDQATQALMVKFYEGLKSSDGKTTALRRAALQLKENPTYAHPYYWGAFVLSRGNKSNSQ